MSPESLPLSAGCERFAIGVVTSVRGSTVTLGLTRAPGQQEGRATVGRFVVIRSGPADLVGVVTELETEMLPSARDAGFRARATVDLIGEMAGSEPKTRRFRRGVTEYPAIEDSAELLASPDLRLIYDPSGHRTMEIGRLQQDPSIPARINVDDLVAKHFAILGATGVGKSSGVAVMLSGILDARPDLRIFLLDVHNEYGRCFRSLANVIGKRNLKLPFWVLNFEETVDVVYGGRPAVAEEIEILLELIPIAKGLYDQHKATNDRLGVRRSDPKQTGYTVDTPVPYFLQDLITLIDERMGRLENRSSRMHYHRLIMRIDTIRNDPRYAFMFENANVGGDMMGELVSHLFRVRPDGKPMTVMQLGGLPAEAVDAVVCVLSRLAFEFGLWSEGAVPLLFVCEEAHRYASADTTIGFAPTRRSLSRIAKEGRKNGVFLGLVTQRPAELDPTIISQCGTLFAMRMANEHDQALLRSAVSDGAANLLAFVPSLGMREAIGFGEGVPVPARMIFGELAADRLPRGEATRGDANPEAALNSQDPDFVRAVLDRWRGATMASKPKPEEDRDARSAGPLGSRPGSPLDLVRSRLLKRTSDLGDPPVAAPPAPAAEAGPYRS